MSTLKILNGEVPIRTFDIYDNIVHKDKTPYESLCKILDGYKYTTLSKSEISDAVSMFKTIDKNIKKREKREKLKSNQISNQTSNNNDTIVQTEREFNGPRKAHLIEQMMSVKPFLLVYNDEVSNQPIVEKSLESLIQQKFNYFQTTERFLKLYAKYAEYMRVSIESHYDSMDLTEYISKGIHKNNHKSHKDNHNNYLHDTKYNHNSTGFVVIRKFHIPFIEISDGVFRNTNESYQGMGLPWCSYMFAEFEITTYHDAHGNTWRYPFITEEKTANNNIVEYLIYSFYMDNRRYKKQIDSDGKPKRFYRNTPDDFSYTNYFSYENIQLMKYPPKSPLELLSSFLPRTITSTLSRIQSRYNQMMISRANFRQLQKHIHKSELSTDTISFYKMLTDTDFVLTTITYNYKYTGYSNGVISQSGDPIVTKMTMFQQVKRAVRSLIGPSEEADSINSAYKNATTYKSLFISYDDEAKLLLEHAVDKYRAKRRHYGYKIARLPDGKPCMVKLMIPKDASVNHGSYDDVHSVTKYRCNKAYVVAIFTFKLNYDNTAKLNLEYDRDSKSIAFSYYDSSFVYQVGERVSSAFNRHNACNKGIHYFVNPESAFTYNFPVRVSAYNTINRQWWANPSSFYVKPAVKYSVKVKKSESKVKFTPSANRVLKTLSKSKKTSKLLTVSYNDDNGSSNNNSSSIMTTDNKSTNSLLTPGIYADTTPEITDNDRSSSNEISFDKSSNNIYIPKMLELKHNHDPDDIPEALQDPITFDLMRNPVVAPDGRTYDYESIVAWIEAKGTSPYNPSMKLTTNMLYPNIAMRVLIKEFDESKTLNSSSENQTILKSKNLRRRNKKS